MEASTDEVEISAGTARSYVGALFRAGYLQEMGKVGRHAVYRLPKAKALGPVPPAVRGDGTVVERNTQTGRAR